LALTLLVTLTALPAATPAAAPVDVHLDPRVTWVESLPAGPFVVLADGRLATVDGTDFLTSGDDGRTWQRSPLFAAPDKFLVRLERALLRTKNNTLILAFLNERERSWLWDTARAEPGPDVRLPTYVMRSTDNGRTWETPQKLHDDWSGAIRNIIQTADGGVVFTTMKILRNPGRHGCLTYRSDDEGRTWRASNLLDLGGHGHHDGALEPAIVQQRDGRLWMLIRTTLDVLYQAHSDDGLNWQQVGSTAIGASTAPPMIHRLASGRLALVWNRLYREGETEAPRRGGDNQWSAIPAINQRAELSLALSADDGRTWTRPAVIVRAPKRDTSYPYLLERRPGELWITTMRSTVKVTLHEKDFVTAPEPPRLLVQDARSPVSLLRQPDGSFAFYSREKPAAGPVALPDRSGQVHLLRPALPPAVAQSQTILESKVLSNTQVILTPAQQVVGAFIRGEALDKETARQVGLTRYLDVWLNRADARTAEAPRRIWRGYNGSQMEYQQFPGGRIVVPFGSMQPHAKAAPPTGRHVTVVLLSDDAGQTWQQSASPLIAPCYADFNGSNEGACEPAIEQLRDGRLWMLMRTQAGFLYETHSSDLGTTWTPATASRFNTSTGPANILRHPNGWLVATWNNCEMPLRHAGLGVYGGRDALHVAVSADEGRTWRGFREIYLDHRRNDNPEKTGDRGTAYPLAAYTNDDRLVVIAGQGPGGRNPTLVDPAWIVATQAHTDFSDGLEQWTVYKHFGPARGWWRGRTAGAKLAPHPDNPAAKCLHVRKADEHPADVAQWNFPNGWQGTLTARLRLQRGHQGAMICLNDRFFDPSNALGQEFAVFRAAIDAQGRLGSATLAVDTWHTVDLAWDLAAGQCTLRVNGQPAGSLALAHPTLNGVSYVRFVSTATALDPAGFLVESVRVEIADPSAPAQTAATLRAHERRYVENVVPRWTAGSGR
jgi:sialidase-1